MPTKWQVIPWEGDKLELLPEVPDDLIAEVRIFSLRVLQVQPGAQARDKVGFADNPGTESL